MAKVKISTRKPKLQKGGRAPASGEKKIKLKSTATNKELKKWPPKEGKEKKKS